MSIFDENILYRALAADAVLNVTAAIPLESGYYTAGTARAAVPAGYQKLGMILIYQTADGWIMEQFQGELADWDNDDYWVEVGQSGAQSGAQSLGDLSTIDTSYHPTTDRSISYLANKSLPTARSIVTPRIHRNYLSYTDKRGGVVFRMDDSPRSDDVVEYSRMFDKYGVHFIWAINISKTGTYNQPSFMNYVKDIQARGHQIMDHTPNHYTRYADIPDQDIYDLLKVHPGVISYEDSIKRIWFEWEQRALTDDIKVLKNGVPCTITTTNGSDILSGDFPAFTTQFPNFIFTTELGWVMVDPNTTPTTSQIKVIHWIYNTAISFTQNATETMYGVTTGGIVMSKQGQEAIMLASSYLFRLYGLENPKFLIQPAMTHAVFRPAYAKEMGEKLGYIGSSSYNTMFNPAYSDTLYVLPSFEHTDPVDAWHLPYWLCDTERMPADAVFRTIVNNSARHIHTVDLNHYFLAYRYLDSAVNADTGIVPLFHPVLDIPASATYPSGYTIAEWEAMDNATKRPIWNALAAADRTMLQKSLFFAEMDRLLRMLRDANIPVYTYDEVVQMMYTPQNPATNMFPPLWQDRSEQGYPEGYTLNANTVWLTDKGVADSDLHALLSTEHGNILLISPITGFNPGRNLFRVWAKGTTGISLTLTLYEAIRPFATTYGGSASKDTAYEESYGGWNVLKGSAVATLTLTLSQAMADYVMYEGYIDIPFDVRNYILDLSWARVAPGDSLSISGLLLAKY